MVKSGTKAILKNLAIMVVFFLLFIAGCNSADSSSDNSFEAAGRAMNAKEGTNIAGATVKIGQKTATTDSYGLFQIGELTPGAYDISISCSGFKNYSGNVEITKNTDLGDLFLYPAGYTGTVQGKVTDGSGAPVSGASVILGDVTEKTDTQGGYSFEDVDPVFDSLTVSKDGYNDGGACFTVVSGGNVTINPVICQQGQTGSVEGTITNAADGTPLKNAQVAIGNASTLTNATGQFSLAKIPSGTQIIRITRLSFQDKEENIIISSGSAATFNTALSAEKTVFRKTPYLLLDGTSKSMTVRWQTLHQPEKATIEWGETSSYGNGPVTVEENSSKKNEHLFSHKIKELKEATHYYYRVTVDSDSKTGEFVTPPGKDAKSATIYFYGDSRSDPQEHQKVVKAMLNDMSQESFEKRHTLVYHGGDMVMMGLNEPYWDEQFFSESIPEVPEMLSKVPLSGVIGNHECYKTTPGTPQVFDQPQGGKLLRKYWPYEYYQRDDRFYNALEYGPILIITLDTWKFPDYTPNTDQYKFLETRLSSSTKKWKMICLHTPIYSGTKVDKDMIANLVPLFKKYGVKIVMQSHKHYYSRCEKDGIQFLTAGGGGAPLGKTSPIDPTAEPFLKTLKGVYNFVRLDFQENEAKVTVIEPGKGTIEEITIK
ncbi:MAG: carboxypeptidase regulatory-like domain-containing protein [Firmicutes bacterium]|nr:carboxypeptidase regulatory-like domain-containing protein [Bacillota bacterium]